MYGDRTSSAETALVGIWASKGKSIGFQVGLKARCDPRRTSSAGVEYTQSRAACTKSRALRVIRRATAAGSRDRHLDHICLKSASTGEIRGLRSRAHSDVTLVTAVRARSSGLSQTIIQHFPPFRVDTISRRDTFGS